jgi:ABC-type lipoprotein export system ATPase subunit
MAENGGMVLVMGVTGSGKSTFINTLKPNSVPVSSGLASSKTLSRVPFSRTHSYGYY